MYCVKLSDDLDINNIYRNELDFYFDEVEQAFEFIKKVMLISDYHILILKTEGE